MFEADFKSFIIKITTLEAEIEHAKVEKQSLLTEFDAYKKKQAEENRVNSFFSQRDDFWTCLNFGSSLESIGSETRPWGGVKKLQNQREAAAQRNGSSARENWGRLQQGVAWEGEGAQIAQISNGWGTNTNFSN